MASGGGTGTAAGGSLAERAGQACERIRGQAGMLQHRQHSSH